MSFTITKISANNFSHFDGFKTMNFSNWEIVFNYTSNTLILQMLNGAPFPKMEVSASDVIIKNGIAGTPETFSTVAEIRARLLELNYNPLQSSAVGSAEWGSIGGDINDQTDLITELDGKVSKSGDTMTGDLILDDAVSIKPITGGGGYYLGDLEQGAIQVSPDGQLILKASDNTSFKGLEGEVDFSDNLTDLSLPQKIYVDTKLPIETPATTGVALTFETDRVYGSIGTPETGNITASTTGAKLGVTNIIIHNSGTTPTFDSKFKKLSGSGSYVISVVNYIYCTYITSTEIIYSINQRT